MIVDSSTSSEERLEIAIRHTRALEIPPFPSPTVCFPPLMEHPQTSPVVLQSRTYGGLFACISGASLTAMAFIITLVVFLVRPVDGFAQITEALLKQSWLHIRTEVAGQAPNEQWISIVNDISAQKSNDIVRFEDHRLRVYHSFDPHEHVLYRGPVTWKLPHDNTSLVINELKALEKSNVSRNAMDKQGGLLGFLGFDRSKVVVQKLHSANNDINSSRLDYTMTIKHADFPEPISVLFQVDSKSHLMKTIEIEGPKNGNLISKKLVFDYPKSGPVDIYDLGVPKDSKLVDRMPTVDLKRIVDSMQTGRDRMDPYRAIYVSQAKQTDDRWWQGTPQVLYKKSNQYRRDLPTHFPADSETPPASDVESQNKWWSDRLSQFEFLPASIQIDSNNFVFANRLNRKSNGSERQELASVQKIEYNFAPDALICLDYAFRPEGICRPPLGIGNEISEAKIEFNPKDGPAGCIELSVGENRFWVDPAKDYIALRWELGREQVYDTLDAARSPNGIWYAKEVLHSSKTTDKEGNALEQRELIHIYVDFDSALPDTTFKIPATVNRL